MVHKAGLSSKHYLYLTCVVLLSVASIFRFSRLGDKDFGLDEILHVHAAAQLIQGSPPVLPSGFRYDRALSFSYTVALAGFVGGFSETILRMPSAILGVLLVWFVYWLTARWFSASAGLVAAFLTTFSPIEIAFSREVRMYMLFQVLFLLLLFCFFEGFETCTGAADTKTKFSRVRKLVIALQVRPWFLLFAGILFFLAWEVHKIAVPGVSGLLLYIVVMGMIALTTGLFDGPIRGKYIGTCAVLIVGAIATILIFPEKVREFIAITQITPPWYEERAAHWSYYRWQLLDEYPIVFGTLTISFLLCLIRKPKLGLFLALSFFVPIILHSVIFPMKSYRYILHVLPIMYIVAGVGFSGIVSFLWSAGLNLNKQNYVPSRIWHATVAGVLCAAIMGMLVNMPWFMRTVRDYANNFRSPHFADVQHHNWKNAMNYVSRHQTEGDIMISSYPLLSSYYGARQPHYFMNDSYLHNNINRNLRNERGELVDYTFGAVVLMNNLDFRNVLDNHPSGWIVTYRWREEGYWKYPDRPLPILGSFPTDVLHYLYEHYDLEPVPDAPDMAVWRWKHGSALESPK